VLHDIGVVKHKPYDRAAVSCSLSRTGAIRRTELLSLSPNTQADFRTSSNALPKLLRELLSRSSA